MRAFVFPGQGSQYIRMGAEFYEQFSVAKSVFEEANDVLNFDLTKMCLEGDLAELSLTANAQPAILSTSVAALKVLEQETDIAPDFVAGHSLGEYSALVASGALSFKDAVHTVRKRGEFMQNAVPVGVGSMVAVIGLPADVVENLCQEVSSQDNVVSCANYNSPQQTVISGHKEAVQKVSEMLKKAGAKRTVPLTVSAPFHSSLMDQAARNLSEVLSDVQIKDLKTPIVTNVEAVANKDSSRVKDLLVQQVVRPVRWFESMEHLYAEKVMDFVEVGPGNVLTGLIKRTLKGVNLANFENIDQLSQIKTDEI